MSLRLEYLYGDLATYQPGDSTGPRKLGDYELVWIIEGGARYERGDERIELKAGQMLLATPGTQERYAWDTTQQTSHAYMHFDALEWPGHWPALRCMVKDVSSHDLQAALFKHLLSQWCRCERDEPKPNAHICSMMTVLLELVFMSQGERVAIADAYPAAVSRALRWSWNHVFMRPTEPVVLGDLARAASVSAKHLCRLFAEHVGHRPMETVRLMRLDRAVTLVARSNLSVKEIADRTGFSSSFHFSRVFKQTFGCSPKQLRAEVGAGRPVPRTPIKMPARDLFGW